MAKFVQIQTCEQGHTHDELINIEDLIFYSLELPMETESIATLSLKSRWINC